MTTYDNTNKGVLFVNDRKETDKHPDMNGSININGVEHWFSGWWKNGAKGEFLSLAIGKPKDQQPQQRAPQATQGRGRPQPSGRAPARSGGFDDEFEDIPL